MKKLILFFLCFFASNAYASSADSGICPWKIPFTITCVVHGKTVDQESWSPLGKLGNFSYKDTTYEDEGVFSMDGDTSSWRNTMFTMSNDTFNLTWVYWKNSFPGNGYLVITFQPMTDSITSLTFSDYTYVPSTQNYSSGNESFQISGLRFNDTSIFCADSSFTSHNISYSGISFDSGISFVNSQEFLHVKHSRFTASSVTLSGIFRPTTFSNPPAIVTESARPSNLSIYSSNGSIACSFDVSDQARNLEIFSPIGIREASFTISPGQTEASLPHLVDGFYFVRLGGSLKKIYVAE